MFDRLLLFYQNILNHVDSVYDTLVHVMQIRLQENHSKKSTKSWQLFGRKMENRGETMALSIHSCLPSNCLAAIMHVNKVV